MVSKRGFDWFAIGGLLIHEEDVQHAKTELETFVGRWPQIRSPLHLTDMRSEHKGFAWLGKLALTRAEAANNSVSVRTQLAEGGQIRWLRL